MVGIQCSIQTNRYKQGHNILGRRPLSTRFSDCEWSLSDFGPLISHYQLGLPVRVEHYHLSGCPVLPGHFWFESFRAYYISPQQAPTRFWPNIMGAKIWSRVLEADQGTEILERPAPYR